MAALQPGLQPAGLQPAEAERLETEQQLKQVLEVTSDAVVTLDREYRFTFLNRRARELLAASGEVLGRTLWEVYPAAVYDGSPFVEFYRQTMEEGKPGSFETYYPEPLNMWLAVESRKSDDGIIVFFRDITQQRAAAEELERKRGEAERQAAEIEAMYRTAPIGLALFDTEEFRYLRLNNRQAQFFGMKPEDIVGKPVTEMTSIPGLRELFEQVKAGTPVVNYPLEGELHSHPGEHRYWTVNYFPLHAADGTIQAIAAASLEVTAQKKAEQALIQNEKLAAVGRLASSISHEINNPLEAVTNLLYLIAGDSRLTPETRGYVDTAQSEIARVSQIATQTLRFHRQSMRPTQVSARQLMETVLDLYQGRLGNSSVTVETKFVSDRRCMLMENEIRQVLNNLIANAIDAMRSGGTLTLRSHNGVDNAGAIGVQMTVADTGHGMSTATLKRVFEPFFTTKDMNGTGLGLWISADIVRRHRGTLRVRSSETPGRQGTVFSLFLPCE